jgi:hypothetical protein
MTNGKGKDRATVIGIQQSAICTTRASQRSPSVTVFAHEVAFFCEHPSVFDLPRRVVLTVTAGIGRDGSHVIGKHLRQ